MSRPPRDFNQDLADSLIDEGHPAVLAALATNYPTLLQIHRAHPANDRLGVDLWLELEGAGIVRVDVKIRKTDYGAKRGHPPDVVLEIDVGGRPGWSMKQSHADSILIVYLDTGRSVAFDAADLRLATQANHSAWLKRFQLVDPATQFRKGRPAVPSVAVAVPSNILQAAIEQLHVLPAPDGFDAFAAFERDPWGSF